MDIFLKGLTHGFSPKMALFPAFFLGDIGQENVFYYILHRKNAFVAYKKKSLKSQKTDIFLKGLSHGFGQKMAAFATFFFRQYRQGKCLLRCSTLKKTPFQPMKTKSSKSRKTDIFPKGLTHSFGTKLPIFPTFLFQAIQGSKKSFTRFQNEKTPFLTIKTRSSKSRKIDIFLKGLTHGFSP